MPDIESYTTLVSCYFRLEKSKHSHDNYMVWMDNFLENVETPLIIFCDEDSEKLIKEKRKKFLDKTKIILTKPNDFHTWKYFDIFKENYNRDFEKDKHSVPLYMIWSEKSNFIRRAVEINPYKSEFFVWIDIGAFRNRGKYGDLSLEQIKTWPNEAKIKALPHDKVILGKAGEFPRDCNILLQNGLTKGEFTYVLKSIVGTVFIMHKDMAMVWWRLYYWMLETFAKYGRVILKDQSIMANVAVSFPKKVQILDKIDGLDPWFFLINIFV